MARGEYGVSRPNWQHPEPVCEVNIAEVQSPVGAHVVVVLGDGSVRDPATDEPRRLTDYDLNWIAGVVPLA